MSLSKIVPGDTLQQRSQFLILLKSLKIVNISDPRHIFFQPIKGALTNLVFIVYISEAPISIGFPPVAFSKRLILRIFGKGISKMICRQEEATWLKRLNVVGLGPIVLAEFSNGRVEGFIDGIALRPDDIRSSDLIPPIASCLARHHISLKMEEFAVDGLSRRLKEWFFEAQSSSCYAKASLILPLYKLTSQIIEITNWLEQDSQSMFISFCHNDLQYANIMKMDNGNIVFVDFEYSGYGNVFFDIANHFCEWMADYDSDEPHTLNYSLYPSIHQQKLFLESYLSVNSLDISVDNALLKISQFSAISHLVWGLWGLIQSSNSHIPFKYFDYGIARLKKYFDST